MRIISQDSDYTEPENSDVYLIFGVGLIGSSICRHLLAERKMRRSELPFSWLQPALQPSELQKIEETLLSLARAKSDQHLPATRSQQINIVWSAGRCGFGSNEQDTRSELDTFARVTEFVEGLSRRDYDWQIRFNLISSAGGLFEGSNGDSAELRPAPMRPYGVLKLEQERLVGHLPKEVGKRIFRLTSVYGYIEPNCRIGLVQRLLIQGVRGGASTIVGDPSTLRDYVFCEDIGRFVCGLMAARDGDASGCYLLSSGKASSIAEVQHHVESTIGRKLYFSFVRNPTNSRDICLSWNKLPVGWSPMDLRTGIRAVHDHWRGTGYAWRE